MNKITSRIDTDIEEVLKKKYDYIIIGSGMYGGYFAHKMAHKSGFKKNILVIEKGDFEMFTHQDNTPKILNVFENSFNSTPFEATVNDSIKEEGAQDYIGLGGKSIIWGRWCPRLTKQALSHYPEYIQKNISRWYDEVEKDLFIDYSEKMFNNDLYNETKKIIENSSIENINDILLPPLAIQSTQQVTSSLPIGAYSVVPSLLDTKMFYNDIEEYHFDILINSDVVDLNKENEEITSISIIKKEKETTIPVNNAEVIIATGMANSTSIAKKISDNKLIGKNLTTHLRSNVIGKTKKENTVFKDWDFDKETLASMHINCKEGEREYHLQLTVEQDYYGSEAGALQYLYLGSKDSYRKKMREIKKEDILTIKIYIIGDKYSNGSEYFPEKRKVKWNLTEEDEKVLKSMTEKGFEVFHLLFGNKDIDWEIDYKDWKSPKPKIEEFYQELSSSYHEASTLIMGESKDNSVVNVYGNFHDIKNLWCLDQSISIGTGSSNPVPTGKAFVLNAIEKMLKTK